MAQQYLTREGYERLKKELNYLTKERRQEISKQLEEARLHGDISENAEYDAAKDAQGLTEDRIRFLEDALSDVVIIDDQDIPNDLVYIGSFVSVKDIKTGEETGFRLVSPLEADSETGTISTTSPVGKALLRHGVGDVVEAQVPSGIQKYCILKIWR
ncbi:MAG: transcription elongation factor GreA [Candidatus Omnitrophica bacterium]|nr:transcription elongation factor GreA [Candidatus Omnitrophota bacterium]